MLIRFPSFGRLWLGVFIITVLKITYLVAPRARPKYEPMKIFAIEGADNTNYDEGKSALFVPDDVIVDSCCIVLNRGGVHYARDAVTGVYKIKELSNSDWENRFLAGVRSNPPYYIMKVPNTQPIVYKAIEVDTAATTVAPPEQGDASGSGQGGASGSGYGGASGSGGAGWLSL